MGRTACTEPQCLYSTAIPLLPLWTVRAVHSLSACTRVHITHLMTTLHAPMAKSMIHGFCSYSNESHTINYFALELLIQFRTSVSYVT